VWSGGDDVHWTEWASLGALLAEVAGVLPSGLIDGWFPVAFRGGLEWKLTPEPVTPEPRSVLALAAATTEAVVPLSQQGGGPRPDPGWIGAYGSESCLTFAENIEPDELLRRFGVEGPGVLVPAPTAPLTAAATRAAEHSWTTGHLPVVRAGQTGNWAFAFEDAHHEGIRPSVLPRLSAGTRAVALYFWGPQLAVMQDGGLVASFSGFQPERLYGQVPQALAAALAPEGVWPWDRFRPLQEHITGLLAVLRRALGTEFDPAVLSGPLPGGPFLADLPDRALVTRGLSLGHGGPVAALTVFAPPDRLQQAPAVQARALASEAGLTGYPEVTEALDRLAAGETWPATSDSPLGLRFRHNQAHRGGTGYQVPVWPDRRTAWVSEPARKPGGPMTRGIRGIH
jgi:hypothetical protein